MIKRSILFVCLGNICRSPACEAICKNVSNNQIKVASAATTYHHINESPDSRIIDVCMHHGIDISDYRAKPIRRLDWCNYDTIVALDPQIYNILEKTRPVNTKAQLLLFNGPNGILDPYYGGKIEFTHMFNEIERNMQPFLRDNNLIL